MKLIFVSATKIRENTNNILKLLSFTINLHSIPRFLLLCLKRNDLQTLVLVAAKALFSSVYVIGTNCSDGCFLFYVITGRHYFSSKINVTLRSF